MSPETLDNEELVEAMLPTAAALTVAVADNDEACTHELLTTLTHRQLQALAVVLAAHIDPDQPFRARRPVTDVVGAAITFLSLRYGIPEDRILTSRDRAAFEARAVACYVGHLAGLSSLVVGVLVDRDHTTVLNAWGRVGANPKLRRIAHEVADQLDIPRPVDDTEDLAS